MDLLGIVFIRHTSIMHAVVTTHSIAIKTTRWSYRALSYTGIANKVLKYRVESLQVIKTESVCQFYFSKAHCNCKFSKSECTKKRIDYIKQLLIAEHSFGKHAKARMRVISLRSRRILTYRTIASNMESFWLIVPIQGPIRPSSNLAPIWFDSSRPILSETNYP